MGQETAGSSAYLTVKPALNWQSLIIGLGILLILLGVTFMAGAWYAESHEIISPVGKTV